MASIVFVFAGPKAFTFFRVCFSARSTLVKSSVFKYFSNWLITYYSLAGVVCVLADFVRFFKSICSAKRTSLSDPQCKSRPINLHMTRDIGIQSLDPLYKGGVQDEMF